MESRYTPNEALLVVDEALNLLSEPECFATGTWKCRATDSMGRFLTDKQGRQKYAYCIEGAINQATINVLGQMRAIELGALTHKIGNAEATNEDIELSRATEELSLNALADKLFSDLTQGRGGTPSAQYVNDYSPYGVDDAVRQEKAYNRVIRILRTKRDQLRRSLGMTAA